MLYAKLTQTPLFQEITLTSLDSGAANNQKQYIKIKHKEGGKNQAPNDGVYVTIRAYEIYKNLSENDQKNHTYDPDDIIFIKEFPVRRDRLYEAFCEMLMGKIIKRFIEKEFIPKDYASCFSCAEPAIINYSDNNVYVLKQPYRQGSIPLFQVSNPDQKEKNAPKEVFNRIFFKTGYKDHLKLNRVQQHGLSYILFIQALLGNSSVHSGNILVKVETKTTGLITHSYTSIDNGAGFRGILGSKQHVEKAKWGIFKAIGDDIRKRYFAYYKRVGGLFESSSDHATSFCEGSIFSDIEDLRKALIYFGFINNEDKKVNNNVETDEKNPEYCSKKMSGKEDKFSSVRQIIEESIGVCYDIYFNFISEKYNQDINQIQEQKKILLKYLNLKEDLLETCLSDSTDNENVKKILSHEIYTVILYRLYVLKTWVRPEDSKASNQLYMSVKKPYQIYQRDIRKRGFTTVDSAGYTTDTDTETIYNSDDEEEGDFSEEKRTSNLTGSDRSFGCIPENMNPMFELLDDDSKPFYESLIAHSIREKVNDYFTRQVDSAVITSTTSANKGFLRGKLDDMLNSFVEEKNIYALRMIQEFLHKGFSLNPISPVLEKIVNTLNYHNNPVKRNLNFFSCWAETNSYKLLEEMVARKIEAYEKKQTERESTPSAIPTQNYENFSTNNHLVKKVPEIEDNQFPEIAAPQSFSPYDSMFTRLSKTNSSTPTINEGGLPKRRNSH